VHKVFVLLLLLAALQHDHRGIRRHVQVPVLNKLLAELEAAFEVAEGLSFSGDD
jgi:hypothetical protein